MGSHGLVLGFLLGGGGSQFTSKILRSTGNLPHGRKKLHISTPKLFRCKSTYYDNLPFPLIGILWFSLKFVAESQMGHPSQPKSTVHSCRFDCVFVGVI